MRLLLFGNPALAMDSLALEVGRALAKDGHETVHLENPLDLLEEDLSRAVILDVAVGVDDVRLLTDVDKLVLGRLCSLHDFDMAYFLKLLKAMGKLGDVRIVALPQGMDAEEAIIGVRRLISEIDL